MRLFILGARAESQLPGYVWKQLQYLFPTESFEIIFIGPESFFDRDRGEYLKSNDDFNVPTRVIRIDDTLKLLYYTNYFHFYHNMKDFYPYDPFTDCFFIFHPGFASPENRHNWLDETMGNLLDTKCPIFVTGFNKRDISEDLSILNDYFGKDLDSLMEPTENVFGSTKWELNDLNPHEVYQFNKYVAGFRGTEVPYRPSRHSRSVLEREKENKKEGKKGYILNHPISFQSSMVFPVGHSM